MNDLLVKYQALSPAIQREVDDFLDFVLQKHAGKRPFNMKEWKKRIKKVSVWTEDDIGNHNPNLDVCKI
jgi:hypothetical protein